MGNFRIVAYRFNNKGQQIAKYENRHNILDAVKIKFETVKNIFPNYEIYEGEKIVESNMGETDVLR